jgi:hypothetical protein
MKVSILGPTNLQTHADILNLFYLRERTFFNLRSNARKELDVKIANGDIKGALDYIKRSKKAKFFLRHLTNYEELYAKGIQVGRTIAEAGHDLATVMGYSGMLEAVGQGHYEAGGKKREMYWCPHDDGYWNAEEYRSFTEHPHITHVTEKDTWHDVLYSLVSDSKYVVCAGVSGGVLLEMGHIRFNEGEGRGEMKKFIGIEELLREGRLPIEFSSKVTEKLKIISLSELGKELSN